MGANSLSPVQARLDLVLRPGTLCSASQTPARAVLALRLRALLFAATVLSHAHAHTVTSSSACLVTKATEKRRCPLHAALSNPQGHTG